MVANNNPSGGGFEHGFYLAGGRNTIVRNNTFANNSAPNGVCNGGNLTVHGVADGLLVENNRIEQSASEAGCYGISITAGYGSAEAFRNVVVRNNTIINVGLCSVCLSAAPGALVESNKIFDNKAGTNQRAVLIPATAAGAGDAADGDAIIRNNVVCFNTPGTDAAVVQAPSAGSVIGNAYQTGAGATTGSCAR